LLRALGRRDPNANGDGKQADDEVGSHGFADQKIGENAAAIGLTVIVLATRVGVVRCNASTQRMNASAPPKAPVGSRA